MKKLIAILLILSITIPTLAFADIPDISGLSFDELVQLKRQINLAMWNSQEWQEVTVPNGIWEIGVDIPAGHWTIRAAEKCGPDYIIYSPALTENGHDVVLSGNYIMECVCDPGAEYYSLEYKTSTDFVLEAGYFIRLDCAMVFTPYTGKPDLGFK